MKTIEYLDAAKVKVGVTSDYALCGKMNFSRQRLSNWRRGIEIPDTLAAVKLAEVVGVDPIVVIADLEIERAQRDQKPERVDAWRGIVQRMGGVAAALVMGTLLSAPTPSEARTVAQADSASLYIM